MEEEPFLPVGDHPEEREPLRGLVELLRAARDGYVTAPPVERSAFGMSLGVASSVSISRLINYLRERRRPVPKVRSVARQLRSVPKDDSMRVHHFLPGLGLAVLAGGAGIATRDDRAGALLSVPFGVGLGLALDELGLLFDRTNAYWDTEATALVGSGIASLISAALGVRFVVAARARVSSDSIEDHHPEVGRPHAQRPRHSQR